MTRAFLEMKPHVNLEILFVDLELKTTSSTGTMEAEERPVKRPRLSQDEQDASVTTEIANGGILQKSFKSNELNGQCSPTDKVENAILKSNDLDDNLVDTNGYSSGVETGEIDLPPPDEIAPLAESTNGDNAGQAMSKNQQKKLRKKLEWESKRDERKVIRKEKMVAKRERKKAAREQSATENGDRPATSLAEQKGQPRPVQLPVTIMIDCDFDDLMKDNERISLASQITRSYSDNRKSKFRAHLAICSFTGMLRERFDKVLTHHKSWHGVRFWDRDFVEAAEKAKGWMMDEQKGGMLAGTFSSLIDSDAAEEETQAELREKGEIVYLTSEADDTLTELKPYSTYIIGGLVDKNREKGICYKRATKRGVKTARLPIEDFMDMQSRKVLATNHVNEIMLKWLECGDWGEAFMKVIPKRKGGKLKGVEDGNGDGNAEDEDERGGAGENR